jgi:hypothetical protein
MSQMIEKELNAWTKKYSKLSKPTRLTSFGVRVLAVGLSCQSHLGIGV